MNNLPAVTTWSSQVSWAPSNTLRAWGRVALTVSVVILEAEEGDRSPGGSRVLSEGTGFGEEGIGA